MSSHYAILLIIASLCIYTLQAAQPVVLLGTSGNFAILTKTGVSTVPQSAITGDVGVSPAATTYLTGFGLTVTPTYAVSTQVTGNLFGADMAPPTSTYLASAVADMHTAYLDAAGRLFPDYLNLFTGDIGGKTLPAGLYHWDSSVSMPLGMTISGNSTDVWIFQITGDVLISAAMRMTLAGGALAKNIFWQVAGTVTVGAGAHVEGNFICMTSITMQTGSSINGRLLSHTNVALQMATVVKP